MSTTPKTLHAILEEIHALLDKGYQKHHKGNDYSFIGVEDTSDELTNFHEDGFFRCGGDPNDPASSESVKYLSNFIFLTIGYLVVIIIGILLNVHILTVFQHFQESQFKPALRAEIAFLIGYLILIIPVIPLDHIHPYTGTFKSFERGKAYIVSFFMTSVDIATCASVWIFALINHIRFTLVFHYNTTKGERCKPKSVRDDLKILFCGAVLVNLPKFFDSSVITYSDPCGTDEQLLVREPNLLGQNVWYKILYKAAFMPLITYFIPMIHIARITGKLHRALRKKDRPLGHSRARVMLDRIKIADCPSIELDIRVMLFYIFVIPTAIFKTTEAIKLVRDISSVDLGILADTGHVVTFLLVIHNSIVPFLVYMTSYVSFREISYLKYGSLVVNAYKAMKRYQVNRQQWISVESRLKQETLDTLKNGEGPEIDEISLDRYAVTKSVIPITNSQPS